MNVIYFDSECLNCEAFVKFVHKNDNGYFHFYSQNGISFRSLNISTNFDTIYVLSHDGILLSKSDAISYILSNLNFPFTLFGVILKLIPHAISDNFYSFYAKYIRAKKQDNCILNKLSSRIILD